MHVGTFTAVLHKEGEIYVAECAEVGTWSQGKSVEDAMANLKEATELYLEEFPPENSSRPLLTVLCPDCPAFQGQRQFALWNDWIQSSSTARQSRGVEASWVRRR